MMIVVLPILALIVILLIFSGFFSGSEIAFAKCDKQRLRKLSDSGNNKASLALRLVDNFTGSLSAILAGNELVNIAASSAVTVLAITVSPDNQAAARTIASASLTLALLIFGEIVPKIVFSRVSDTMVLFAAKPIFVFTVIFRPLVSAVDRLVEWLSPLWTPNNSRAPSYTSAELSVMIDDIESEGNIDQKSADLMRRTLRFHSRDLKIRDIMTSRVDVAAFCLEDGLDSLMDSGNELLDIYSRIPVYGDSLDDILGILSTRDYIRKIVRDGNFGTADVESFKDSLEKPLYIYEGRSVYEIYRTMRKNSSDFAVVLDEFGGMTGIVTMEDIAEQIVGEIYDERDTLRQSSVLRYTETDDSLVCVVRGELALSDLFDLVRDRYNHKLHEIESSQSTVAGWTTELLGHVAEAGDIAEADGIKISVINVSGNRAKLLKLEFTPDKQV